MAVLVGPPEEDVFVGEGKVEYYFSRGGFVGVGAVAREGVWGVEPLFFSSEWRGEMGDGEGEGWTVLLHRYLLRCGGAEHLGRREVRGPIASALHRLSCVRYHMFEGSWEREPISPSIRQKS